MKMDPTKDIEHYIGRKPRQDTKQAELDTSVKPASPIVECHHKSVDQLRINAEKLSSQRAFEQWPSISIS